MFQGNPFGVGPSNHNFHNLVGVSADGQGMDEGEDLSDEQHLNSHDNELQNNELNFDQV